MNSSELVAETISLFAHWRSSRCHPKERTPEALKQKAVELLPHIGKSQVCELLGLSPSILSRWEREAKTQASTSSFIELPTTASALPSSHDMRSSCNALATVYLPNGTKLVIELLTPELMTALLSGLEL